MWGGLAAPNRPLCNIKEARCRRRRRREQVGQHPKEGPEESSQSVSRSQSVPKRTNEQHGSAPATAERAEAACFRFCWGREVYLFILSLFFFFFLVVRCWLVLLLAIAIAIAI